MAIIRHYWPSLLTLAVILYATLSSSPLPSGYVAFEGLDKIIHFTMMGGLAGAISFDYMRSKPKSRRRGCLSTGVLATIFAIVAAAGILTEVGQACLTANRSFEVADIAADLLGALTGVCLARPILHPILAGKK